MNYETMKVTDFTHDRQIQEIIRSLNNDHINQKAFSDVLDKDGHQYVDIVLEGGGVLGIALVGFTYCLEQMGIRFLGIGGTSAGAINALFLASLDERQAAKSDRMIELIANLNLPSFLDGDKDARDFIETFMDGAGRLKLGFKALQIIDNLEEDLGLNPGKRFQEWVETCLKKANITTTAELQALLDTQPAGLHHRDGAQLEPSQISGALALIAAEVPTETKVEFPKMARLFWKNWQTLNPSYYVRASMSIPFFFHPLMVNDIPSDTTALWEEFGYTGTLPTRCLFIDGGIMSNFPIDVFHEMGRVPQAPTFGVQLGLDRSKPERIDGPIGLAKAIFNCARHTLDYDFLTRNPDYRHLVSRINTGEHHWLNFYLNPAEKIDLFRRGVDCASRFLRDFDWASYKVLRGKLVQAYQASNYNEAA